MGFYVLISFKIIWCSKEKDTYPKSFYSAPLCYISLIPKSTAIVVKAYDEKAAGIRRKHKSYTAKDVQHKLYHLKGIRFPQRKEQLHKFFFTKRENMLHDRSNSRDWTTFATPQEFSSLD